MNTRMEEIMDAIEHNKLADPDQSLCIYITERRTMPCACVSLVSA